MDRPRRIAYYRPRLRRRGRFAATRNLVDVHPQEPLLADFPFDINDFQAFRTRHALGSAADFLQIHAETPRPRPVRSALQPAPTKKWACSPLIVRPASERYHSIFALHGKSKVRGRLALPQFWEQVFLKRIL